MFALIRMDWILQRSILLKLSPLFMLWLLAGAAEPLVLPFIAFLIAVMALIVPMFPYLGPVSIEPFLWALPVSRAQMVVARYLSALGGMILGLTLPLLIAWICHQLGTHQYRQASMTGLVAGMGLQVLVLAVVLFTYLPYHFRFGGDRGIGYCLGTWLILLVMVYLCFGLSARGLEERLSVIGNALLDGGVALLGACFGTLALGTASLWLSISFYRRRAC